MSQQMEDAVEMSTSGDVTDRTRQYAVDKVAKVLGHLDQPVLHTSIRLDQVADPAREHPASARATIDVNGEPVRAHVAAATMTEAVDLLEQRLRHRLEHIAQHRRALRRRGPGSPEGEWRHGDLPSRALPYHPRPVEDREVVRHKMYTAPHPTIDEAIFDLEAMDFDFLVADLEHGQDAFLARRPGGTYGLRYLEGPDGEAPPDSVAAVEVDPKPAPVLTLAQAQEHLDGADEAQVFFKDADTGRGHVLYRRYDGHYGLITPADA